MQALIIAYMSMAPIAEEIDGVMYPPVMESDIDRFFWPMKSLNFTTGDDELSSIAKYKIRLESTSGLYLDRITMYKNELSYAIYCYRCWDMLDDVKRFRDNKELVLEKLRILRYRIGPDAYYLGIMPPLPMGAREVRWQEK